MPHLPATVSFKNDVEPFLITSCGGGNGCRVIDASSTMSSGDYDHVTDDALPDAAVQLMAQVHPTRPDHRSRVGCRAAIPCVAGLAGLALLCAGRPVRAAASTEQWGMFELALKGPATGNPYTDVRFSAQFYQERGTIEVLGFYDGGGIYRLRFMPPKPGKWHYTTVSSAIDLEGRTGEFVATKPHPGNHGPVRIAGPLHNAYADGSPYQPVGVTCSACARQGDALASKAAKAVARSPFTKVRLTVFPRSCNGRPGEPPPIRSRARQASSICSGSIRGTFGIWSAGSQPSNGWGSRSSSSCFQTREKGWWDFDRMKPEDDDRYLHYVVARFSAFRSVWWLLADTHEPMANKTETALERLGKLVAADDAYHHPLSIRGSEACGAER